MANSHCWEKRAGFGPWDNPEGSISHFQNFVDSLKFQRLLVKMKQSHSTFLHANGLLLACLGALWFSRALLFFTLTIIRWCTPTQNSSRCPVLPLHSCSQPALPPLFSLKSVSKSEECHFALKERPSSLLVLLVVDSNSNFVSLNSSDAEAESRVLLIPRPSVFAQHTLKFTRKLSTPRQPKNSNQS